jgi:hypothetical protein
MMAEGVRRMDELFATALASGRLTRDTSLDLPPPPVLPELPPEQPIARPAEAGNAYQVQIIGKDVTIYNFAMAHLRTLPGILSATPQQINASGTSYVLVRYRGDIAQLAAALGARGWIVETSGGNVVRMHSSSDKPPALPPPPQPAQPPPQPQPAAQPSGQAQ